MKKKLVISFFSACLLCGAIIGYCIPKTNVFDGNIDALTQSADTQSSTKIPDSNTYQYWVDWSNDTAFQDFLEVVSGYSDYATLGMAFTGEVWTIAAAAFVIVKNFANALNPQCMYINCCGPNGLACDPDGEYLAQYKLDCMYFKKGIYAN